MYHMYGSKASLVPPHSSNRRVKSTDHNIRAKLLSKQDLNKRTEV